MPGAASPPAYRAILRRASVDDTVGVTVRVTDPLGRMTEQMLRIPAGSIIPLPDLSPIDAMTIAGRGRVFSFSTNAPIGGPEGVYRLNIAVTPQGPIGPILPPGGRPPRGPGGPGPLIRPRPGPVIGIERGASPFTFDGTRYLLDMPLGDIPTPAEIDPSNNAPLLISRQTAGSRSNLSMLARFTVQSVLVRIVTPDGRTVERKRRG
jgi:hypothetical protein